MLCCFCIALFEPTGIKSHVAAGLVVGALCGVALIFNTMMKGHKFLGNDDNKFLIIFIKSNMSALILTVLPS